MLREGIPGAAGALVEPIQRGALKLLGHVMRGWNVVCGLVGHHQSVHQVDRGAVRLGEVDRPIEARFRGLREVGGNQDGVELAAAVGCHSISPRPSLAAFDPADSESAEAPSSLAFRAT
jgi:hypothetical protein